MPKFVEGLVDRLEVSSGARDVQVFDDDLPGFGIRKFDSGKASYFVKFNVGQQQRRLTIGKVVRGNLKAMRLEASKILSKARLGMDAAAERKAAAAKPQTVTLGEIVPKYLAARESKLRKRSHAEARRYLEVSWEPLHDYGIDAIARRNIVARLDDLESKSGKVAADRARTSLSALYSWAIDRGYCEINPTMNIKARAQNGTRSRVLTEGELVEVWRACIDDDYGRIVRLLMLTGQRREEIAALRWAEVDLDKRQIVLPGERTKNHRPHVVPLSDASIALLPRRPEGADREFVFGRLDTGFSGWSKGKAELDARIAEARVRAAPKAEAKSMPAWVLHDLRRSFVTHISERGFAPPHVVEAIVNHISGHKGGVAGVYNRAAYANEKRQALELWGAYVTALVDGRKSNVVPLRA